MKALAPEETPLFLSSPFLGQSLIAATLKHGTAIPIRPRFRASYASPTLDNNEFATAAFAPSGDGAPGSQQGRGSNTGHGEH